MPKKIAIIALCMFFGFACDSDSDQKGPLLNLEVPEAAAPAALFGIWQLTAVRNASQTTCPVSAEAPETIQEDYRLMKTDAGCSIHNRDEEGRPLRTGNGLFDVVNTRCRAGGNIVTLEWSRSTASGGCTEAVQVTSRLTLSDNQQELNGSLAAVVKSSGTCPGSSSNASSCTITASLEGRRSSSRGNNNGSPEETFTSGPAPEASGEQTAPLAGMEEASSSAPPDASLQPTQPAMGSGGTTLPSDTPISVNCTPPQVRVGGECRSIESAPTPGFPSF